MRWRVWWVVVVGALMAFSALVRHRAMPLQHRPECDPRVKNVMIVDIRGPTRSTGDGVRVMGMLMDLHACGHHVEVLSDAKNREDVKQSWPHEVAKEHFKYTHFWRAEDANAIPLELYHQFILGAKLDLLFRRDQAGSSVPGMLARLRSEGVSRKKVAAFWDDVPFERCAVRAEAAEICPRVPDFVRAAAEAASTFYVLSVDDKNRMLSHMYAHNIPTDNLDVRVWPMKIANMQKALQYAPFEQVGGNARDLVVMMGNLHAVNKLMVTRMFESGAVGEICRAIDSTQSGIKLRFVGGLAMVAEEMMNKHLIESRCVEAHPGFISDFEFRRNVLPRMRAVLNPFFQDVNSGISVKNFESIMSGMPFLTSEFGMHGLSDEIQDCATFPMPDEPSDPSAFAQFFINNIVNATQYAEFARAFAAQSPMCIQGQLDHYPARDIC